METINELVSQGLQGRVRSRSTRVMFDEEKIPEVRKCERHLPRSLALPLPLSASCSVMFATSLHSVVILLLGHVVPKAVPTGTTSSFIERLSRR